MKCRIQLILASLVALAACSSTLDNVRVTRHQLEEGQIADRLQPSEEYFVGQGTSAALVDAYPMIDLKSEQAAIQLPYLNDMAGYLLRAGRDITGSGVALGGFVDRGHDQQQHVYDLVLYRAPQVGVLATTDVLIFSTPGGFIWPSMGMLNLCDTEDEAAALIAIELGHIMLDHTMSQYRAKYNNGIATSELAEVWFSGNGHVANFGRLVVTMMEETALRLHSNEFNLEADRYAALLLLQAGYEPRAITSLLLKLALAQRLPAG